MANAAPGNSLPPHLQPHSQFFSLLFSTKQGPESSPCRKPLGSSPPPWHQTAFPANSFLLCQRTVCSVPPRCTQNTGTVSFHTCVPSRLLRGCRLGPTCFRFLISLPNDGIGSKEAEGIGLIKALRFCPKLQTKRALTKDSVQSPLLALRTKGWHVGMALGSDGPSAPSVTCLACCHGTF